MTQRLRIAMQLTLAAVLVGLTACSGGSKETTTEPVETAVPTVSATESAGETPTPNAAFLAPLTGLPAEKEVTNRPFAVSINNLAPARPQSGMTQADTVWEVLAEGGITRFVAIFQSKEFTDPIGPVRSIRPYFIQIGEFYSGIVVHAGASNDAFAILQKQKKEDLDEITNAGAYFYRDKSRKAPHNVYTTLEKLREGTEKRKYKSTAEVPLMAFNATPPALATAASANQIDIKFMLSDYKVSYAYDSAKAVYARSINGKPHIDKNNDQQLTATNLVVLNAKHDIKDDVGRLVVDLDKGGDAILFQNGKAIPCQWERKDGDVIRLVKDGQELPFLPGVTYYHVVPNSTTLDKHVTYQ
ncbi:DUF3048 domain-containing protein [Cohnella cholangitidis]|uniref:DUF3048 domain-containing protein n=1 Tax=Cohnella cholangitidis TaxID=2598458 RepID=A0A7G5BWJ8_9BACL|nr:DUF3048 domain-containing protein [Cohnella cholangitidis]QMV41332.1 DUF3048 domain-containing protein [Cohnella cholangitidis]